MNQGDKVVYRKVNGRGHPAVGTIVGVHDVIGAEPIMEIKNKRTEQVDFVHGKMIVGEYKFKPYNMKARKLSEPTKTRQLSKTRVRTSELEAA